MLNIKFQEKQQANNNNYVDWFLEGCILSNIPESMISIGMICKVDALWWKARTKEDRLRLPPFQYDKTLLLRDLINNNLSKLGIPPENKIGGKLNGNK